MKTKKVKLKTNEEKIAVFVLAASMSLVEAMKEVELDDLNAKTTALGMTLVEVINELSIRHDTPVLFIASIINTLVNNMICNRKMVDEK